jgi:putative hydrolase of the HAD superfamily
VIAAVLFDGDDTLWRTEWLYDDAREDARKVVERAGLDGDRWEAIERRVDVENVARLGHAAERFPSSCVQAYEQLCHETGTPPSPVVSSEVREAARSVFARRAPLIPGARETLLALRREGVRLALVTKGDAAVQRRRIAQSGLGELFDLVEIVHEKTPALLRSVADRLGVRAREVLSVGNSVRSDVLPSLAAGMRTVWIDAHVWEFERSAERLDDDRVIRAERLPEILALVRRPAAA